jgi:polyhydroxybutyrate depolymerase
MGQDVAVKRVLLLVVALLLAGCGASGQTAAPSPSAPCDPGPPGTRQVQVGKRSFLLHVPTDFQNPSPAVFTFHGRGSNAQQQLLLTGFDQVAEEGRFLVVAPEARNGRWDFTGGDADYLRAVGAAVPCMDPSRVYASGMSMGSAMTFALACAPDRKFAAFGGVALTLYQPQCEQSSPGAHHLLPRHC